jgi:outer membrane protein assembly complex protein YaeT
MRFRSRSSRPLGSLAAVCLGLGLAGPARAPAEVAGGQPVEAVEARPALISDWELRRLVAFRLGEPVGPEAELRSVQALRSTERFEAVEMHREPASGGERLVFVLRPQPYVKQIRIRGNEHVSRRKIRSWLPFRHYDRLGPEMLARVEEVLGDRYEQAGFGRPAVRVRQEPLGRRGARRIWIEIQESPVERLGGAVRVEGRPPELQLHERIALWWNNRRDHLWSPPALNPVHLKAHEERAIRYLRGIGFVEAEGELQIRRPAGKAEAVVQIEPGKRAVPRAVGGGSGERRALEALFWDGKYTLSQRDLSRYAESARNLLAARGIVDARLQVGASETEKNKFLDIAIEGGRPTTVRGIEFQGNRSVPASELRGAMLTSVKSWVPFSRAPYDPGLLEEDVKAVAALYALRGFAAATAEAEPHVSPNGDVTIEVRVVEGPHQSVGEVQFEGQTELSGPELQALARRAGLKAGADLSRSLLSTAAQAIAVEYARRGYPDLRLQVRPRQQRGEAVDLVVQVEEGQRQICGKLIAVGNYKASSATMLRGVGWKEGTPLNPGRLARLRERQVDLGVFDSVLVESVDRGEGVRDVLVRVDERRSGALDLSLLFDNVLGGGLEASLSHENLFGRGLRAGVEAGASATGLDEESVQLLRLGASLRKATILGQVIPATLSGFYVLDRTASDRESRQSEGSVSVARSLLGRRLQTSISVSLKSVKETLKPGFLADPNSPLQSNRTFSISPRVVFEGRDEITNPRRGTLASLRVQLAPSILGGENDFVEADADVRRYLDLGSSFTLAVALRGGVAVALAGQADVPSADRFFLGGDSTHRAFPFGELGPRTPEGTLLGGTSFALANAELRFPVLGALHGGLFVDLGNAFASGSPFELRAGFGLGLRYLTVIGPIRADVGWNPSRRTFLRPPEGEPEHRETEHSFVYHVALGHAF